MRKNVVAAVLPALAGAAFLVAGSDTDDGQGLSLVDALKACISRNLDIQQQGLQVRISQALYQQQRGAFDGSINFNSLQSRIHTPLTSTQEQLAAGARTDLSSISNLSLGWQQTFRNGVSFGPSIGMGRTIDNLTTLDGLNRSQMSLQLVIPLLRGRGREVATTYERSARIEADATASDLNQVIELVLAQTASNYWSLVAATKTYAVARQSEERGFVYQNHVQTLIDAEQSPKSDINNVAANLAERRSYRIAAGQVLLEARQFLLLSMGVLSDQVNQAVTPTDDFPAPPDRLPAMDSGAVDHYLQMAISRRGDLQAALKRVQEARTLAKGARNLLLPSLNLVLSSGYSGLREGGRLDSLLVSPLVGIRGADLQGGLVYSFAPKNNAASGQVAQTEAALRQAELHERDLRRQIANSILVALQALYNATLRLRASDESVHSSEEALDGQKEKLRLGSGSIIDLLTVEDRLTTALLNNVQARLSYPLALTQFRLATGTLVDVNQPTQTLDVNSFTKLPDNFLYAETVSGNSRQEP